MPKIDKAFFKRHLPFFLILIGTFLFWLSIKFNSTAKTTIRIPLNYEVPRGYVLEESVPKEISAVVEGRIYNLIDADGIQPLKLTLTEDMQQTISSEVLSSQIEEQLDKKVTLQSLPVSTIDIIMDKAIRKVVPINTNNIILEPSKYNNIVSDISINPDSVEISGPAELVSDINFISTKPLQKKDLHEDLVDYPVHLATDNIGFNMSIDTAKTYISVRIDRLVEKDLKCALPSTPKQKIVPENIVIKCSYASRIDNISCADFNISLKPIKEDQSKKIINLVSQNELISVLSSDIDTVIVLDRK